MDFVAENLIGCGIDDGDSFKVFDLSRWSTVDGWRYAVGDVGEG